MAGDDEETYPVNPHPHEIKSQNADLHSFLIFFNRTMRKIDVLWCNYSGNEVRYQTLTPKHSQAGPQHRQDIERYSAFCIDTFVSHPWIARDSHTGHLLRVNQRKYLLPVAYDGEESRHPVYIDIPVFSLRERCLEEVRRLMDVERLSSTEVPASLISSLKTHELQPVLTYADNPDHQNANV